MSNKDYLNLKVKQKLKLLNFKVIFFLCAMVLAKKQGSVCGLNNNFPHRLKKTSSRQSKRRDLHHM